MDTQIDDDEELIFDDAAPDQATEATPEEKAESAASEEPAPTAAAPGKRSRTGMAVAAGFALCIIASVVSAIQSWRAAATAQHSDTRALAARLNNIEKLLERQRDAIDLLAARPNARPAANGSDQINALAAAVRANQEISERLPSVIMRQVEGRLARVTSASRPAVRTTAIRKAAAPKAKRAAMPVVAAAIVPVTEKPPEKSVAAEPVKRPVGEAIRYP